MEFMRMLNAASSGCPPRATVKFLTESMADLIYRQQKVWREAEALNPRGEQESSDLPSLVRKTIEFNGTCSLLCLIIFIKGSGKRSHEEFESV
eukprot:101897-Pelagomonas_calceolata.AAC.1